SDGAGKYQFVNLNPDSYTVLTDLPTGYTRSPSNAGSPGLDSNPSPSNVTLTSANLIDNTIDFGFCPMPNLTVTKTADATLVTEGTPIGFTVSVANGGSVWGR